MHWGGLSIGLSLGNISSSFELDSNRNRGFSSYQGNMCNSLIRQGCDVNLGQRYRESPAQAYREAAYERKEYEENRGYGRGGYGRDGCFGQGGPCSIFNLGASGLFADHGGRLAVSGAYQNPDAGWGRTGANFGLQDGGFSFNLLGLKR